MTFKTKIKKNEEGLTSFFEPFCLSAASCLCCSCEAFTQPRSTSLTAWAKIQQSKQCTVGPSTVKRSPSLVPHHSQPEQKYKNQNNVQCSHLLWSIHPASFYPTHSLSENTRIKTMYSGSAKIQELKQCTVEPSTVKHSPSLVPNHSQPGWKYKNQNNVQCSHLLWIICGEKVWLLL